VDDLLDPRPAVDAHGFDRDGWREHANCKGIQTTLFYPEQGCSVHEVNAAKAVCRACPVVGPCLEYAIANCEMVGIWGGTSERERRAIRRLNHRRVLWFHLGQGGAGSTATPEADRG
jgi:hypothetical protein